MREKQTLLEYNWSETWPYMWQLTIKKEEVKDNNMGRFWIVVNPNETKVIYKGSRGGYHKHTSEDDAIKEAQRLAQETGTEYAILGLVAQIKKVVEPTYKVVRQ